MMHIRDQWAKVSSCAFGFPDSESCELLGRHELRLVVVASGAAFSSASDNSGQEKLRAKLSRIPEQYLPAHSCAVIRKMPCPGVAPPSIDAYDVCRAVLALHACRVFMNELCHCLILRQCRALARVTGPSRLRKKSRKPAALW